MSKIGSELPTQARLFISRFDRVGVDVLQGNGISSIRVCCLFAQRQDCIGSYCLPSTIPRNKSPVQNEPTLA